MLVCNKLLQAVLILYLCTVIQEATILEVIGDVKLAEGLLVFGKDLSLEQGWSILGARFSVVIGTHTFTFLSKWVILYGNGRVFCCK